MTLRRFDIKPGPPVKTGPLIPCRRRLAEMEISEFQEVTFETLSEDRDYDRPFRHFSATLWPLTKFPGNEVNSRLYWPGGGYCPGRVLVPAKRARPQGVVGTSARARAAARPPTPDPCRVLRGPLRCLASASQQLGRTPVLPSRYTHPVPYPGTPVPVHPGPCTHR